MVDEYEALSGRSPFWGARILEGHYARKDRPRLVMALSLHPCLIYLSV